MQQNTQTMNIALSNSVLHRAKPEILSIVEHLIEKMHVDMTDLLVEVYYNTTKQNLLQIEPKIYERS